MATKKFSDWYFGRLGKNWGKNRQNRRWPNKRVPDCRMNNWKPSSSPSSLGVSRSIQEVLKIEGVMSGEGGAAKQVILK